MILKKSLFIALILIVFASTIVSAEITSPNQERTCVDGRCTESIYGAPIFAKDSSGQWVNSSDVLSITRDSDDIIFHYNGIEGNFNITFESGAIYNGNYFPMATVKSNFPQLNFNFPSSKERTRHKYAVNITNINATSINPNLIESITLTYKTHSGFTLSQLRTETGSFVARNIMNLAFDDLLDSGFTISTNISERRIYIGNISANIVDGSLFLDPTITILANGTGMKAYWASVSSKPTTLLAGTEFTSGEYDSIAVSDDVYAARPVVTGGNDGVVRYNFTIPAYSTVQWANFSWEGTSNGDPCATGSLDVWNFTSAAWYVLLTDSAGPMFDPEHTLTVNVTATANLIDGNRTIHFMTYCEDGVSDAGFDNDYVQLLVSYTPSSTFPDLNSVTLNTTIPLQSNMNLNITANVTNTTFATVTLDIINPSGTINVTNQSMTLQSPNIYYFGYTTNATNGNWTIRVYANTTSSLINSSATSFLVTTSPAVNSVTLNRSLLIVNENLNITANVTNSSFVSAHLDIINSSSGIIVNNGSMTLQSKDIYYFNFTTSLPTGNWTIRVYANTTQDINTIVVLQSSFIMTSTPRINSITLNRSVLIVDENLNITVNASNSTFASIHLDIINASGGIIANNQSMTLQSPDIYYYNHTTSLPTGTWTIQVYTNTTQQSDTINSSTTTFLIASTPTVNSITLNRTLTLPNENLNVTTNITNTTFATARVTIVNPSGTTVINNASMTLQAPNIYYYAHTTNTVAGTWNIYVYANTSQQDTTTSSSTTYISTLVPGLNSITLNRTTLRPSENLNITVNSTNSTFNTLRIDIINPSGSISVNNASMTLQSPNIYYYSFTTNSTNGLWTIFTYANTTQETPSINSSTTTFQINLTPSIPTNFTEVPSDPQVFNERRYFLNATICDADGPNDIGVVKLQLNNVNNTVIDFVASGSSCRIYQYNTTNLATSQHNYTWFVEDILAVQSNQSSNSSNYTVTAATITINAFAINDTYIHMGESINLTVNLSGNFSEASAEVQTTGGIANISIPGNGQIRSLILSSTQLGSQNLNASTINITRIYAGGSNYTLISNTTTLSFNYGLTSISSVTDIPDPQTNAVGDSVTFSANYSTVENASVSSRCELSLASTLYNMTAAASLQSITVSTSGTPAGTYTYTINCTNSNYQSQFFNLNTLDIVQSGSGPAPSGSGGGGDTPTTQTTLTQLQVAIGNETLTVIIGDGICSDGETIENSVDCKQPITQASGVVRIELLIIVLSITIIIGLSIYDGYKRSRRKRR